MRRAIYCVLSAVVWFAGCQLITGGDKLNIREDSEEDSAGRASASGSGGSRGGAGKPGDVDDPVDEDAGSGGGGGAGATATGSASAGRAASGGGGSGGSAARADGGHGGDHADAGLAGAGGSAGIGDGGSGGSGAGGAGASAAGSGPVTAGQGGAPVMSNPKATGEFCSSAAECGSGNCRVGSDGTRRCHGLVNFDASCETGLDCKEGDCVRRTRTDVRGVCVDSSACASAGECFAQYGLARCQLDQLCTKNPASFNQCYSAACRIEGFSNMECSIELQATDQLYAAGCCPPGGVLTGSGSCDNVPQCGCSDNLKCVMLDSKGATECQAIGMAPLYGVCSRNLDCPRGAACIGSLCKPYCSGTDSAECGSAGTCRKISFNDAPEATPPEGGSFCSRKCDPVMPQRSEGVFAACPPGKGCEPFSNGFSDCGRALESGTEGSSCTNSDGEPDTALCTPGTYCNEDTLRCTRYCYMGSSSSGCSAGASCNAFSPRMFADTQEIGWCAASS